MMMISMLCGYVWAMTKVDCYWMALVVPVETSASETWEELHWDSRDCSRAHP